MIDGILTVFMIITSDSWILWDFIPSRNVRSNGNWIRGIIWANIRCDSRSPVPGSTGVPVFFHKRKMTDLSSGYD